MIFYGFQIKKRYCSRRASYTGLKCPMPERSKRSKAELLDCDIDELSTVDQFSKNLRIMKHKVELLDW